MKRVHLILSMCLCAILILSGCTKSEKLPDAETDSPAATESPSAEKTLRLGSRYALSSVDVHKEYRGWQTSIYGISETLFKVADDFSLVPWLAESGTSNGSEWKIVLKEKACFSNGDPLTADMVVRNLERVAKENPRFEYLSDFTYKVIDDKTFTITGEKPYPTMLNVLSSCETGIIHLDKTTDFDNTIIATGPFVLKEFEPEGTIKVARNENYWNGSVALDGAEFYKIPEEDALLLAMQNGEIDAYMNVNAAAKEIYEKEKDIYRLVNVPSPRLQLYILNQKTLSPSVREAISLTVDSEKIVAYLGEIMSVTSGPFSASTPYGKVNKAAVDTKAAADILEKEGYRKNGEGYFEKDGKKITVNIAFYPGRSLDVIATVMQEQLRAVGIEAVLTSSEGPDVYLSSGDFDIALLSMNADIYGDPEFFITNTLKQGSHYNVGGFQNDECEKMIEQLSTETDFSKRSDLANKIVQIAIDDHAFGYVSLSNKITVLRPGISGFAETSPYDFYGINALSDKK